MKRRIPKETVSRAIAVVAVTIMAFLAGTMVLSIAEQGAVPFVDIVFETASAMGTVGVSSVGTPQLSLVSRIVLVPMMYMGRVGTLTLAFALSKGKDERHGRLRYPEENVTIG